jgi:hypothetical protein
MTHTRVNKKLMQINSIAKIKHIHRIGCCPGIEPVYAACSICFGYLAREKFIHSRQHCRKANLHYYSLPVKDDR